MYVGYVASSRTIRNLCMSSECQAPIIRISNNTIYLQIHVLPLNIWLIIGMDLQCLKL